MKWDTFCVTQKDEISVSKPNQHIFVTFSGNAPMCEDNNNALLHFILLPGIVIIGLYITKEKAESNLSAGLPLRTQTNFCGFASHT